MLDNIAKQKLIKKEKLKLNRIFVAVPENKKKVIEKLIDNASFMAVSLDDLQNIINEKGYTDTYQNGENQFGTKQSEEVKIHLAMQKNYTAIIDRLLELVPVEERGSKLESFVKNRPR